MYVSSNVLITRELKSRGIMFNYLVWLLADESVDLLKKKAQESDRNESGLQTTIATANF